MMNKYCVAYFDGFEGELRQKAVEAEDRETALRIFLKLDVSDDAYCGVLHTGSEDELINQVAQWDCMINVIEV